MHDIIMAGILTAGLVIIVYLLCRMVRETDKDVCNYKLNLRQMEIEREKFIAGQVSGGK